jgi:hypothetical protein
MKHKKIAPFKSGGMNTQTTIAIVAGLSIGLAIGALFATKKGRDLKETLLGFASDFVDQLKGNTAAKAKERLGNLIGDVKSHVKRNADGQLAN